MPKAKLHFHLKRTLPDGAIVEMVFWQLPASDLERTHGFKYRCYYGKNNVRIVGYDNERGKGDHRHFRGVERPYKFEGPEKLIADFMADIRRVRGGK
jgi:hypothetical protein